MPTISRTTRNIIFSFGLALVAFQVALIPLLPSSFFRLPGYLKVAAFIPVIVGTVMLFIDTYIDLAAGRSIHYQRHGFAVGSLIALVFIAVYCFSSWLSDVAG